MTRILISVTVALAIVGGGAYYVTHRSEVAVTVPVGGASAQPPGSVVVVEKKNDEDLTQKRLEGIGSVKTLKPVELGPTLEQEAREKKH